MNKLCQFLRFCLCNITTLSLNPLSLVSVYSPINFLSFPPFPIFVTSSLQEILLLVLNLHILHVCPQHNSVYYMYSCVGNSSIFKIYGFQESA